MSAFMHGTDHIDLIVSVAQEVGGATTQDNATTAGRALLAVNARSVCFRYDVPDTDDEARGYVATVAEYEFRPVDLSSLPGWEKGAIESVKSYRYQSCEYPGWGRSAAKKFIEAVLWALTARADGDVDEDLTTNWWEWSRPGVLEGAAAA